jgi:2-polyprenyl-3-methyl-5-hydroxy-6-metoxy-1,4-benzoquinol methylase
MPKMELIKFLHKTEKAISRNIFAKITISKKNNKASDLNNIYIRLIAVKGIENLSFQYRHQTKDIVKNYSIEAGIEMLQQIIGTDFLNARLFTTEEDIVIEYSKKRIARTKTYPPTAPTLPQRQHNKEKKRWISSDAPYLQLLGITNSSGQIIKDRQDKFKQINKYIEIIDNLIQQIELPKTIQIVDMGCGKGYLTFALYDYLTNNLDISATVTGIELRQNLVDDCNKIAKTVGFDGLNFEAGDIHHYDNNKIDILIALHACDIATDIAIAKGIQANAQLVVCAPCCHQQIRSQMNCQTDLKHILKHGILEERQAEMITDGIRALALEGFGYKSKVFEFISSEHTAKNLMIVGTKTKHRNSEAFHKIQNLKIQFGIDYHYIEKLLPNMHHLERLNND